MHDDSGPAFPARKTRPEPGDIFSKADGMGYYPGMTLRDAFALSIIGGMVGDESRFGSYEQYAKEAYKQADAMLAERNK